MTSFRKKMILAGCCFALGLTVDLAAQFPGFDFNMRSKRANDAPTKVKAESMDIDINKNQVTLIGNVDVDDQDMNIKCRKMILYFVDKKNEKSAEKPVPKQNLAEGKEISGAKNKKKEDEDEVNRKIDRIECIGEVEITRTVGEGKDRQLQKAFAEKAVYRMRDNIIALTGDPVVSSGKNQLRGEFITIDTKSGRISVLRPDSRIIGGFKGLNPEKKEKEDTQKAPGGKRN